MKKIVAVILLTATILSCAVYAVAKVQDSVLPETAALTEIPFTDVKKSQWFYDEVVYVYNNGIFKGVTETTFEPNTAMTRAMFVMTLANIEGVDLTGYNKGSSFTDVKENRWYTSAVNWAVENKVASGVGSGRFEPNKPLTREQLATMLYNYVIYTGISVDADSTAFETFADSNKVSSWAQDAMVWATDKGIITGKGEATIAPRDKATRAEVARILMVYLESLEVPATGDALVDATDWKNAVAAGSERQLLLDEYVINTELGEYSISPEVPVKKEAVFCFDGSHETRDTVYHNITQMPDGTYRMYYKATRDSDGHRSICYIESEDGLTWTRPNLNYGTNIVTSSACSPDNLFVFYDNNPDCSEDQRIKGIYGQWGDGLFYEHSERNGDWFQFWPNETKMMGNPTQTQGCYFDTLNTVYWDENRGQYVAFVRGFHTADGNYNLPADYVGGEETAQFCERDIRVAFSDDCVNWTTPQPLSYNTTDSYQLYANAIVPYYRSESLYVGMPTRFFQSNYNYYTQVFFMSSRDLVNWTRTEEPYLTPENSKSYRYEISGYPCIGYIETAAGEMSFYMKEYVKSEGCTVLYRYTLRVDGFMSISGSELNTKAMTFEGDSLLLNATGDVRVTVTDNEGNRISTDWLSGDNLDTALDLDLTDYQGKKIVLTFEMKEGTKLYSFKFN